MASSFGALDAHKRLACKFPITCKFGKETARPWRLFAEILKFPEVITDRFTSSRPLLDILSTPIVSSTGASKVVKFCRKLFHIVNVVIF